jgi:GNAT superfamily N-acetyltransferase
MPAVRLATDRDLDAIAATLTAALADDPWTRWALPPDRRRENLRDLCRLYVQADGLPHGEIWVTDACEALAMWLPPGHQGPSDAALETLAPAITRLQGERADAAAAMDEVARRLRPARPHWYLAAMGTVPDRRRRGLGSAVLAPVLERCDSTGVLAACDTAAERNLGFLARHGFAVAAEADVPGGGPHVWQLTRRPRA